MSDNHPINLVRVFLESSAAFDIETDDERKELIAFMRPYYEDDTVLTLVEGFLDFAAEHSFDDDPSRVELLDMMEKFIVEPAEE